MTAPISPTTIGKASDHLANERTFLAWIRTSISVIVFGFVVAKFGITLREFLRMQGNTRHESGMSLAIGVGFMAMGIFMALISLVRYRTTMQRLNADEFQAADTIVVVLGLLMLNRWPHLVRCTPLMVTPKPAATKKTPNIRPPAAGFHFTQAESASASSARIRIHTHAPKKRPAAKRAWSVHPVPAFQVALQDEQQQPRNPGHQRHQNHQHRHLAEHVLDARKRPRQVQRERVVGEIGRDQAGTDERRQKQRQHALPAQQRHEEHHVDGDQPVGALHTQQAQRAGVVLHVDDQRADQRIDVAGQEEDVEEARAVQVFESVARDHPAAAPAGR